MLDQLRRLVGGSAPSNEPAAPVRATPNRGPASGGSRSGSLSRLAAYGVQQVQQPPYQTRVRVQYSFAGLPIAYPLAYGRPYEPWYPVRYQPQQAKPAGHKALSRQSSARPDLAPSSVASSSGVKKRIEDKERAVLMADPYYQAKAPLKGQRLVPSRSLDSIHPHRISQQKRPESPKQSSSQKVKGFLQRVKDSVTSSSSGSKASGQGHKTDEWLLLRPSIVTTSKPPVHNQNARPTTPGLAAFRKIFARSPSPLHTGPAAPLAKRTPVAGTRSLFQQMMRPRSRSVSSATNLSSGEAKTTKPAELDVVAGAARGDPDGATFPRDGTPATGQECVYAPASEPPTRLDRRPDDGAPPSPAPSAGRRPKAEKKKEAPAFRVRRRQSQSRRSDRRQRSARRSARAKKGRKGKAAKTGQQASGSQSALSGAKLVSDWTYMPLPATRAPELAPEQAPQTEAAIERSKEESKEETGREEAPNESSWESELYQVLVDRPRRALPPPMWDPLIFIPPERRSRAAEKAAEKANAGKKKLGRLSAMTGTLASVSSDAEGSTNGSARSARTPVHGSSSTRSGFSRSCTNRPTSGERPFSMRRDS